MNSLKERLTWARAKKSERDGAEFTQEDLALKAGVTQGAIAHLESGRTLSSRDIAEIAYVLGVDARWLAYGKGQAYRNAVDLNTAAEGQATPREYEEARLAPVSRPPKWLDPDAFHLLNIYFSLDKGGRKVAKSMIEGIAGDLGTSAAINDGEPRA